MSNSRWSIPSIIVALVATLFFAQTSPSREKKQDVISQIEIQGNRRIPTDTIRTLICIRPGDTYHAAALERDFNSLWKTGYFYEIHITRETSDKGWIIHIYVKERPAIRKTPATVGYQHGWLGATFNYVRRTKRRTRHQLLKYRH
jgi:outer membrane protein assembly factor BamA